MARTQTLGKLIVRIEADATRFNRTMKKAEASVKRLGQSAINAGKALTKALTLPIAIVGGLGVKAFADFDLAMKKSLSIMKTTGVEVKQMTDLAKQLSLEGPQSATELAQAYFFLASAGKNAQQSMALLPMMQKFATAGSFDLALATDLLTDAQSALGLSSQNAAQDMKNASRVADVFARANELANTSIQQVSEAIGNRAGASLKVYGKDVEEGVAVLAAYADQTIKGQVAGTELSRVMLLLSKSTRDAAEAHAKFGFHVFDSSGNMRNFADIVKNLEDILSGMSPEMKSATLQQLGFEARIQGAILPLIGTSKAIRRYEAELRKAAGTTKRVSDKQLTAFANGMKLVKNNVNLLFIEIGEALAPVLKDLGAKIREVTQWFRELSPETKRTIMIIAAVTAVVGPLLIVLGLLLKSIGLIIGAFAALGRGLGVIKTVVATIGLAKIVTIGLVTAAGLLIAKVIGVFDAYSKLNAALAENIRLNNKLHKIGDKAFDKTMRSLREMAPDDAIAKAKELLAMYEKNLPTVEKRADDAAKALAASSGWWTDRNFGEKETRAKTTGQDLATIEGRIRALRDFIDGLKEVKKAEGKSELLKRVIGTPLDPKVIAGVKDLTASLTEQMGVMGKTSAEAEIWKLTMMGASKEQIAPLNKLAKELKSLEKAHEVATSATEEFRSPASTFKNRIADLNNALDRGLITWEIYSKAVQKAKADFANATSEVNNLRNAFRGLEGVAAGSKDAKAALRLYQEGIKAPGLPAADIRKQAGGAGAMARGIGKALVGGPGGLGKGGVFDAGAVGDGSKSLLPGHATGKGMGKGGLPEAKDKAGLGKKLDGIADHLKRLIKATEKKAGDAVEVKPAGFKG